tara:strand:+ start:1482 stop:2093 length:612 start_codon:yes stop_codon:yes gene_type:complete
MKIYILRHEDRTMDCTFFSPLTQKGLENSIDLISKLRESEINLIFCSPFIRTLQTIYPYSEKYKINLNLEYSLAEFQHDELIPKRSYSVRLPEYLANDFNYNNSYVSEFEPEDFKYPEKIEDVKKRVKKFFQNMIRNYHDKKVNILIVTHQLPCNILSKLSYEKRKENNDSEYSLDVKYPTGALTKIFDDNKWEFEPINWSYG